MIAFDTNVLSLLLFPKSKCPSDFRDNKPISYPNERIDSLIAEIGGKEAIIIPALALSEVLVLAAPNVQPYLERLSDSRTFRIAAFGTKAAIELAIRVRKAKDDGDKREGLKGDWVNFQYDRQIVAVAKVEGASTIYSTDRGVHAHAKLWGLTPLNISDIPIPAKQHSLEIAAGERT